MDQLHSFLYRNNCDSTLFYINLINLYYLRIIAYILHIVINT